MGYLMITRRRHVEGKGIKVASYTGDYIIDADGNLQFLTSGMLVLKRGAVVDAFLVGGGGAGRYGGGGGGYTKTARSVALEAGQAYEIVIGEGGVATQSTSASTYGTDGETTQAFGYSAEGGKTCKQSGSTTKLRGGDGGSGGGAGTSSGDGGNGASNGLSGQAKSAAGGTGQGYTTRAFGEEDGALYAAGGGGCPGGTSATPGAGGNPGAGNGAYSAESDMSAQPNTGSGGGGTYQSPGRISNGGSGIVIVRRAKEIGTQILYQNANEHAGLTEGWTGTAMNGSSSYTTTKRAPNIARGETSIIADSTGDYGGVFHTAQGIDMTPYKTLVFEGTFIRMGKYTTGLRACVWSKLADYYGNNIIVSTDSGENDKDVDIRRIEVDVTDVNQGGIVGIGMSNAYAEITSCYLIPK